MMSVKENQKKTEKAVGCASLKKKVQIKAQMLLWASNHCSNE